MTDNVLLETICLFCVLLCFQIFTVKLILWPKKKSLTYAILIVNWIFGQTLLEKRFLLFLMDFKLLMLCNNIVTMSEMLDK